MRTFRTGRSFQKVTRGRRRGGGEGVGVDLPTSKYMLKELGWRGEEKTSSSSLGARPLRSRRSCTAGRRHLSAPTLGPLGGTRTRFESGGVQAANREMVEDPLLPTTSSPSTPVGAARPPPGGADTSASRPPPARRPRFRRAHRPACGAIPWVFGGWDPVAADSPRLFGVAVAFAAAARGGGIGARVEARWRRRAAEDWRFFTQPSSPTSEMNPSLQDRPPLEIGGGTLRRRLVPARNWGRCPWAGDPAETRG